MIKDMDMIKSHPDSHLNILWYMGSDDSYDYFKYVYSMFGRKKFKVPKGQLVIKDRFVHDSSADEKKYQIIKINNNWSASYYSRGKWRPKDRGVAIETYE